MTTLISPRRGLTNSIVLPRYRLHLQLATLLVDSCISRFLPTLLQGYALMSANVQTSFRDSPSPRKGAVVDQR